MDHNKLAKRLSILWCSVYILVFIGLFAYTFVEGSISGTFEFPGVSSAYQIFLLISVLCFFIPLAILVHRHAKLAGMRKLKGISLAMTIFLTIWALLCGLAMFQTMNLAG